MTTYIEEFVAKLGFEIDGAAVAPFEEKTKKLVGTFQTLGKWAGAAAGVITGTVAVMNRGTAKVDALASSVGITTDNLIALSNAVKPLGFEVDNVADLVEEMNNKFGESKGLNKPVGAVADATRILGLEWSKLKNLKPEDQFAAVIDAAAKLPDAQAGASAVDMLFGGEGNKILGYLRTYGKSLGEILEDQKRLNMLSDEGVEGAKKFDSAFLRLLTVGKSLVQEFSGKLGAVLAPIIEDIVDWIVANEDLVATELEKWIKDVGDFLFWLWETARDLVVTLGGLIDKVGGLKNAFRIFLVVVGTIVAIQFASWIYSTVVAVKALVVAIGGLSTVLTGLKFAALGLKWLLIFALVALVIEDIVGFLTGKDSVVGDMSAEFENLLELANEYWAAVMGMDPEQFRSAFVGFLSQGWESFFSDSLSWWGEFFSDLGRMIADFFVGTWSWAVDRVEEYIGDLVGLVSGVFSGIVAAVQWYIETLTGFISGLGTGIYDFFANIGQGIEDLLSGAFEFVRTGIGKLVNLLPDRVKQFLGLDVGTGTGAGVSKGITSGVGEGVRSFVSGIAPTVGPVAAGAGAGGMSINITVPTNLAVTQKGEMSPEELSRSISKHIGTEVSRAVRNTSEGVDY